MAQKGEIRFTQELKEQYCRYLAEHGQKQRCARMVGFNPSTINTHEKTDPEFAATVMEAMEDYRESIEEAIKKRAMDGTTCPVFSKDGTHVGDKVEYSDRLLELHAKRHIPAYRDKQTIDHNVRGGVLVVPGMASSSQEWEQNGGSAPDAEAGQ